MESSPSHMDQDIIFEVNTKNLDQNLGSLSADLFEEKIEEINGDMGRFDAVTELYSKTNFSTGKENNLESMTINEIYLKSTQSRASPSTCQIRVPLSTLPKNTNITIGSTTTWKLWQRQ